MSGSGDLPLTRRELVTQAATTRPPSERELLTGLIALEQLAVAVYELVLTADVVSPVEMVLLLDLQSQESAHAGALARVLGLAVRRAPAGVEPLQAALIQAGITLKLSKMRTARDWFGLLETLESTLEGAYYAALADLTRPEVAALAASILASEAQHLTLLFRQRHPLDVYAGAPSGLVHGTAPPGPKTKGSKA
jgi:hypothetical protein